mmetsp:Transcript_14714/g.41850  ORF Transcript_14714/g.41850 Transcript_14714/m.41850 type:complete len:233 (-) Transcript_14714:2433-3131(-)
MVASSRSNNHPDSHVEVAHKLLNNNALKGVLLSKHHGIRTHNVEQRDAHGGHTTKETRTAQAFPVRFDTLHVHVRTRTGVRGEDIRRARGEYATRNALVPQLRQVVLQRARVARIVLPRTKLLRVHKDAAHHVIGAGSCLLQQLQVAVVQGPHGRNKPHPGLRRELAAPVPHFAHGLQDGKPRGRTRVAGGETLWQREERWVRRIRLGGGPGQKAYALGLLCGSTACLEKVA